MDSLSPAEQKIVDFIYNKPEVVVLILNHHNYDIAMETATLSQINALVFKALYIDNNKQFSKDLDSAIANDGYVGFVMIAIAVASAIVSGIVGANQAKKQRELDRAVAGANLSQNEALAMEQLRSDSETSRTKILTNSLFYYRDSLQKQSEAMLKDTWITIVGIGVGVGILYLVVNLTMKNNIK